MDEFTRMIKQIDELKEGNRILEAIDLAEQLCSQARAVGDRGNPYHLSGLIRLAWLSRQLDRYHDAKKYNEEILRVLDGCAAELLPVVAMALNSIVEINLTLGDYPGAARIGQLALAVNRDAATGDEKGLARSLENLAVLCVITGDYTGAQDYYRQASEVRERHDVASDPDFAMSLNNEAGLYMKVGDYEKAQALYARALAIWHAAGADRDIGVAQCLINCAQLHKAVGSSDEAVNCYERIMDIWRDYPGKNRMGYAMALNSFARLCVDLGRWETAKTLYDNALSILRLQPGPRSSQYAVVLDNLAEWYRMQGRFDQAEEHNLQAQAILADTVGKGHPDYAISLINLALVCAATGQSARCLERLNEAALIDDGILGRVFSIGSEKQRLAYLKSIEKNYYLLLSLAARGKPSGEAEQAAFDLTLRRKAIAAEALAVQREVVLEGRHPELKDELRALVSLRTRIAQATLAGPETGPAQAHAEMLKKMNEEKESLEVQLATHIPEMDLRRRLEGVTPCAVARALPEGSVLVEFVCVPIFDFRAIPSRNERSWQPARYLAFVLHSSQEKCRLVDLGDASRIDRMIDDLRDSIVAKGRSSRDLGAPSESAGKPGVCDGDSLRAALFDPLVEALDRCKRLVIAPDGGLTRLPFEVMPSTPGPYLTDDYHISYVGTGRDLLHSGISGNCPSSDAVVVADPDFELSCAAAGSAPGPAALGRTSNDVRDLHFDPLPETRREGERVARALGVDPWLGADVLEGRVKSCRSPSVLHFATHGFFLEDQLNDPRGEGVDGLPGRADRLIGRCLENPLLRSGLALAGANTWLQNAPLPVTAEDGLLTAEDVTGMDLLNCEMVVLSACETGLGVVRRGEGVFGLRRAFALAGAKTLIMSLWKVPDKATGMLMEQFYGYLRDGSPRSEALRRAQSDVRAVYPQPYDWGAFICQGNPGKLENSPGMTA